jgi:membrane protein YqaA with SNARE-associated domain
MIFHTKTDRRLFIGLVLILSIVVWTWLLIAIGPDAIVEYIGVRNGYIVMFLVALFGGISSFSGFTYIATIITLAAGGLDPVGLALASALGISIGDTAYYCIGRYGLRSLAHNSRFSERIVRISNWLRSHPSWLLFLFVYVYAGFTPLPNDLLAIALGITFQRFTVVLPALVLGNATLTYFIASVGAMPLWG